MLHFWNLAAPLFGLIHTSLSPFFQIRSAYSTGYTYALLIWKNGLSEVCTSSNMKNYPQTVTIPCCQGIVIYFTSLAKAVAKYFDECACLCLCLSACLSVRQDISGTARAIFTNFLCTLPMAVARSFSGTLTIGRIAYRREWGDGCAQRGRSVIYDCLVKLWSPFSSLTVTKLQS